MNPVAIQYIWQAIQDSERSDDLSFIDALKRSLMPQSDRPGAVDRTPIAAATIEPLRTVTLPLLSRP
jgi:hypothetical protein